MKISLISLGCAKNRIDSELVLGVARKYNIEITPDIYDADVIFINTCGFIESSKKESIDTILEVYENKKKNVKIVAIGCLVERYYDDLIKALPEVDIYLPIRDYDNIDQLFMKLTSSNKSYKLSYLDRVITTSPYSAYLKIGDGCNNRCAYCAIPLIRGNYHSRNFDEIMAEAKLLADKEIKEITLIAQDTTVYGTDFKNDNRRLNDLLHEISLIENIKIIRVLYLYPDEITKEILNEIKNNPKVVKYFDIPIQHSSNRILKSMNRRGSKELIRQHISNIRKEIPSAIIRTTLITGFPGETDEDFNDLLSFVKEIKFERLGCFTYSDEDDTAAKSYPNKVNHRTAEKRHRLIMEAQTKIAEEFNKSLIGNHYNCIIDEYDEGNLAYIGRNYMYAPDDVDGKIYIYSPIELEIGSIVEVEIVNSTTYDLEAKLINPNVDNF